ncbi:lycopene cyclase domain-containing protein [Ruicaihuangia caeni]|uniref:Lycopene cyclase domain-containing protein n=1 Tax=Ruicaihuangia caeni TaxID=3042517 RepID=A0AAW6T9V8_9MICO|nr:lycopene cyclase domain-containing protein [Klugiella sp. YN-L-19]MDI2098860.1 lycopene cyclase domain-containing protein [Klugiella sp. YN-L-19]
MSYALFSAGFLALSLVVLAVALISSGRGPAIVARWWRPWLLSMVALLLLTAVFDNVMIWAGLFDYEWSQTAGVRVLLAPVEDFAYPVAALLLLPGLALLARAPDTSERVPEGDL